MLLLTPVGCKQSQPAPAVANVAPQTKTAPATPLAEKKDELGADNSWTPALDAYIEQALPQDLLSLQAARAVHTYCPAFGSMTQTDQRVFWAYTLQAMSAAEAGLKPTANVHHTEAAVAKTDSVTHRPIRQQGLLQLAYEDSQRYGCDFDWPADSRLPPNDPHRSILNPETNLSCGLKILDNQITSQGKPLVSRTSYWSTLQPGTVSYRVFAKQMTNVPSSCGLHRRHAAGKVSAAQ
jgi:hypothetical protein